MSCEGTHKPGTWAEKNVITCRCAGCGVELLSPRCRFLHLPKAARMLNYVFMRIHDEERPLANHKRPYCQECAMESETLRRAEWMLC